MIPFNRFNNIITNDCGICQEIEIELANFCLISLIEILNEKYEEINKSPSDIFFRFFLPQTYKDVCQMERWIGNHI